MRVAIGVRGIESHLLEQHQRPGTNFSVAAHRMGQHRLLHRGQRASARIQRGVGVLKDHLEPGAQRTKLATARGGDVDAVEDHLSARRVEQPHQAPTQRRLAAPALAHQSQCLSGAH